MSAYVRRLLFCHTDPVETLLSVLLGVSLSAASGFRVFVPPLVMSLFSRYTAYDLPQTLAWMESGPALFMFAAATLIEVSAFYVPWLDNALDAVAAPLAVLAGVLITGAFAADLDPTLRWTLALVAGGGAAAGIQTLTSVTRLLSSGTTGGLGNPLVSSAENAAATGLSLLAFALPFIAFLLVVALLVLAARQLGRFRARRREAL